MWTPVEKAWLFIISFEIFFVCLCLPLLITWYLFEYTPPFFRSSCDFSTANRMTIYIDIILIKLLLSIHMISNNFIGTISSNQFANKCWLSFKRTPINKNYLVKVSFSLQWRSTIFVFEHLFLHDCIGFAFNGEDFSSDLSEFYLGLATYYVPILTLELITFYDTSNYEFIPKHDELSTAYTNLRTKKPLDFGMCLNWFWI